MNENAGLTATPGLKVQIRAGTGVGGPQEHKKDVESESVLKLIMTVGK